MLAHVEHEKFIYIIVVKQGKAKNCTERVLLQSFFAAENRSFPIANFKYNFN